MKRLILLFSLLLFVFPSAFAQNNARMLSGVNPQTGATYLFVAKDSTRLTAFASAVPVAATLSSGLTAFFGAGSLFSVVNNGAGAVTITCTGCTINGAATLVLLTGWGADIYGDGRNYTALVANPSAGGGNVSTGTNNTFLAVNTFTNISNVLHVGGNTGVTLAAGLAACPVGTAGCHIVVDGPLAFTAPLTYSTAGNPLTIECVGSSGLNLNNQGTLLTYTPPSWSLANSVAIQISNNTRFTMKGCNLTQGNGLLGPVAGLTNIVGNGAVATANCTAACSFAIGQKVYVTGNTNPGFNNHVFAVTGVGASSFTFVSSVNATGTGGNSQAGVVGLQTLGSNGGDIDHSQIYGFTGVQYDMQDAPAASSIYNTCESSHFRGSVAAGGRVGLALTQVNSGKVVNSNTFTNCVATGYVRAVFTTGAASENVFQGGEYSDQDGVAATIIQFGDGVTSCRENDLYTVTEESTGPANQIGVLNGCAFGTFKFEGGLAGTTPAIVTDSGPAGTCHHLELAGGFAGGPNSENTCSPLKWDFNGNIGVGSAGVFAGTPPTINMVSGWGLAATGTTAAQWFTTGALFPVSASSPSFGYDIKNDGVPFTSGTVTPTVASTTALNAMLAARCPAPGTAAGCLINLPPNTNILLTAPNGSLAAIPIPYEGVKFRCMGGHGAQYTFDVSGHPCKIYVGNASTGAGLYAFSTGTLGNGELVPLVAPEFEGITFVDNTNLHNAGGALMVMDTNKSVGHGLALINGFRQPAVAAPSAPTCSIVAGGSVTPATGVLAALQAWTTSGPSLPSASTNCGNTTGPNGTISVTIPAAVAPIIGYEVMCEVPGAAGTVGTKLVTCSHLPTFTLNGDGSQNLVLPSASPLLITTTPPSGDTRQVAFVDSSHSGGFSFKGSIGWDSKGGFSNGQYFHDVSCLFVQGCVMAGIGSATVTFDNLEVDACDVVLATGLCGGSAAPANNTTIFSTPGAVIGTSDLRLKNVHGTGWSTSNLNSSTGCLITLEGFNNQIIGGTIQGGSATSLETGVCMVNSTRAIISGLIVADYLNCFTADGTSKNNFVMFVDNTTCTNIFVDTTSPGNNNQWLRGGSDWTVGKSWAFNMANLVWSGTFPTILATGCGGPSGAALNGTPSGTIAFAINTGTTPGTTCTITMPTATGSGWVCSAFDATGRNTADGSWDPHQDSTSTTTSLVLKFYAQSGAVTAPPASHVIRISCGAY